MYNSLTHHLYIALCEVKSPSITIHSASSTLRHPQLPLLFLLHPADFPLVSWASLASCIKGQRGLCRAVLSTGRSAGDSCQMAQLMNSRHAGRVQRKRWALALQEKAENCPLVGKIYTRRPRGALLRQANNYLETTFC